MSSCPELPPEVLDDGGGFQMIQRFASIHSETLHLTPLRLVLLGFALSILLISLVAILCRRHEEAAETSPPSKKISGYTFFLLAFTGFLDYFCTDQYQPSMPDIAIDLGVNPSRIGLTIQMHQVCCGLASLVFSPLSDHLGRQRVILGLQVLLVAGTLCCGCAKSYEIFLLGRAFQGISACSASIILAITRDCYEKEEDRLKAGGLLFSAMLLGPLVAPPVGGIIATRLGWRATFFLLTGCSLGIWLATAVALPETAPAPPQISYLGAAYRTLANRRRLLLLLCCGLYKTTFSTLDCNNASMLETFFGLPVQQASMTVSLLAFSGALGIVVSFTLGKKPMEVVVLITPLVLIAGACDLMGGIAIYREKHLSIYVGCICLQHFTVMIPNLAVNVEFVQDLEDIAGMASCVQMAGAFSLASLFALPALLSEHAGAGYMLCVLSVIVLLTQALAFDVARKSESLK